MEEHARHGPVHASPINAVAVSAWKDGRASRRRRCCRSAQGSVFEGVEKGNKMRIRLGFDQALVFDAW
jgi:hypothetical protein